MAEVGKVSLQRFGSHGYYTINLDIIGEGTTVIDAGVGTDTLFIEQLLKARPDLYAVGIDPQTKSHEYVEARRAAGALDDRYRFLQGACSPGGAAVELYLADPAKQSRSTYAGHKNSHHASRVVPGIDLKILIATCDVSLVKMDIEGGEYDVLCDCYGVPQITLEWHDVDISTLTWRDTLKAQHALFQADYVCVWIEGDRGRQQTYVRRDLV